MEIFWGMAGLGVLAFGFSAGIALLIWVLGKASRQ